MKLLLCLSAALSLYAATSNRAPLQPNAYDLMPLGSVTPKGWLLDQLKLQAAGLSGHLDEFWPDLGPGSAVPAKAGSAAPISSTGWFPSPT
jgi:hypothetical protein